MSNPSVDVVIPAYNASRFIAETIQSVFAQTYLPRKIIVVDDGSTDNTIEIVKSFESELIELISVENGGVSRARNIGIKASEAEYVAFLDADDVFHRQKLDKQIQALKQSKSAHIAYCFEDAIDESGNDISQIRKIKFPEKIKQGNLFNSLLHDQYRVGNPSSLVVARSALLEVDGFDEKLRFSEDFDLIMRLAERYHFVCVQEALYSLRFSDTSTTGKVGLLEDRMDVFLNHLAALEKFHEYLGPDDVVVLAQISHLENLLFEANNTDAAIKKINTVSPELGGSKMGFNYATLPSVDVVIPAYNASRFIAETIQSVLNQTYLPRKIIIVDDGSTDNTVEIIKSFKSELIELISVENSGVSRARNIGIKASKADYIAFLDADDIWEPGKLEAQLRQLRRKPEAGVCYAGSQLIDDAGADIENAIGVPYVCGQVFEDIVYYERPIYGSASSVVVERAILLQTNLFDETMQFSEDVDLWAHLALVTEFEYVSQPYVKIRIHSSSATRNKSWDKDLKILLQHFYYLNKFANTHSIPSHMIKVHKNRIIRLFFNYPSRLTQFLSFYRLLRHKSPYLANQMGYKAFPFFMLNIFWITAYEVFHRIRTRAVPFKRLKLFFSEGTIFFSKSKKYNPDVEFVRKKR